MRSSSDPWRRGRGRVPAAAAPSKAPRPKPRHHRAEHRGVRGEPLVGEPWEAHRDGTVDAEVEGRAQQQDGHDGGVARRIARPGPDVGQEVRALARPRRPTGPWRPRRRRSTAGCSSGRRRPPRRRRRSPRIQREGRSGAERDDEHAGHDRPEERRSCTPWTTAFAACRRSVGTSAGTMAFIAGKNRASAIPNTTPMATRCHSSARPVRARPPDPRPSRRGPRPRR